MLSIEVALVILSIKLPIKAGWQSGYAEACKALYAGSIPASAF